MKHPLLIMGLGLLITADEAQAASKVGLTSGAAWVSPEALERYHALALVGLLIFYRKTKRFKDRPCNIVWTFLDHNIVEVILGATFRSLFLNTIGFIDERR